MLALRAVSLWSVYIALWSTLPLQAHTAVVLNADDVTGNDDQTTGDFEDTGEEEFEVRFADPVTLNASAATASHPGPEIVRNLATSEMTYGDVLAIVCDGLPSNVKDCEGVLPFDEYIRQNNDRLFRTTSPQRIRRFANQFNGSPWFGSSSLWNREPFFSSFGSHSSNQGFASGNQGYYHSGSQGNQGYTFGNHGNNQGYTFGNHGNNQGHNSENHGNNQVHTFGNHGNNQGHHSGNHGNNQGHHSRNHGNNQGHHSGNHGNNQGHTFGNYGNNQGHTFGNHGNNQGHHSGNQGYSSGNQGHFGNSGNQGYNSGHNSGGNHGNQGFGGYGSNAYNSSYNNNNNSYHNSNNNNQHNNHHKNILVCPNPLNQSAVYQLSPDSAGYPAGAISTELLGSPLLPCLVLQRVLSTTPPLTFVDDFRATANTTCPYTQLRLWQYQSLAFSQTCWVLQNYGDFILYRECPLGFCRNCTNKKPTMAHVTNGYGPHTGGHQGSLPSSNTDASKFNQKLCITDYRATSLWAYCPGQPAGSRLVRDRIILPLACQCLSVRCDPVHQDGHH